MSSPLPIIPGRLPAAPQQYDRDNEAMTRRIIELALARGPTQGGEGGHNRIDIGVTTALLDPCDGENGTIDLTGSSGALLIVTSNGPARVRLYANNAGRTVDEARPTWREPDAGIGLLLDLLLETEAGQAFLLQPSTWLYNADTPVADVIYYRITNYGEAAAEVGITFTAVPVEE